MNPMSDLEQYIAQQFGDSNAEDATVFGTIRICLDTSIGSGLYDRFMQFLASEGGGETGATRQHYKTPLFVTMRPAQRRERGLSIPPEFVIDIYKLKLIEYRCKQLAQRYPQGLDRNHLRTMCAGACRKFLCLDDDNHGRGVMEFSRLRSLIEAEKAYDWKMTDENVRWCEHVTKIIDEGRGKLENQITEHAAFRYFFDSEFEDIKALMKLLKDNDRGVGEKSVKFLLHLADDIEAAYPKQNGHALEFQFPAKCRVLVIDDEADEFVKRAMEMKIPKCHGDDAPTLGNIYDFDTLKLPENPRRGDMMKGILSELKTKNISAGGGLQQTRQYDLILMDLCLGDKPGTDFTGYLLLPELRRFFPLIPIIVCSKYHDMGHIERALHAGANWYLFKHDLAKLPAHHLSFLEQSHWRREWDMIKSWRDERDVTPLAEEIPLTTSKGRKASESLNKAVEAFREAGERAGTALGFFKPDGKPVLPGKDARAAAVAFKAAEVSFENARGDLAAANTALHEAGKEVDDANIEPLSDVHKFLVYKATETLPGKMLPYKQMGGIGGARTLRITKEVGANNPRDDKARLELPSVVVKIAQLEEAQTESIRYHRFIGPYLGNSTGRVEGGVHRASDDKGPLGAIVYTFAGHNLTEKYELKSFRDVLRSYLRESRIESHGGNISESLKRCVETLCGQVLSRIHGVQVKPGEDDNRDFPNLALREHEIAANAYIARMPRACDLECSEFQNAQDASHALPVYLDWPPNNDKSAISALANLDGNGLLHRVNITPQLGKGHAYIRTAHIMRGYYMDVGKEVLVKVKRKEELRASWGKLWGADKPHEGKDFGEYLKLAGIPFGKIVDLCEWMQEESIRGLLENKKKKGEDGIEREDFGIVHGDLNSGNIMVEVEKETKVLTGIPWLIDFARTCRGKIALDYTQLELDLCINFTMRSLRHVETAGGIDNTKQDENTGICKKIGREILAFLNEDDKENAQPLEVGASLEHSARFVCNLMKIVKGAATKMGVDRNEYLAARVWQCLLTHRLLLEHGEDRRKWFVDEKVLLRCVWSLQQAFLTQHVLACRLGCPDKSFIGDGKGNTNDFGIIAWWKDILNPPKQTDAASKEGSSQNSRAETAEAASP